MKPAQPKLPRKSQQQSSGQQRDDHQLTSLVSGRNLETLILDRFESPEQVVEYNKFEELSKLYEIERPFVPRTQVELLFDVYDGRRPQQAYFGSLDDGEQDETTTGCGEGAGNEIETSEQDNLRGPEQASCHLERQAGRQLSLMAHLRIVPTGGEAGSLSWCKILFARRDKKRNYNNLRNNKTTGSSSSSPFKCCLKPSGTSPDLGLVSLSTSGQDLANRLDLNPRSSLAACPDPLLSSVLGALAPDSNDPLEETDAKQEALEIVSSALAAAVSSRGPLEALLMGAEPNVGQALVMESAQLESSGGSVSVCLLDKRRLALIKSTSKPTSKINGRRWARASSRLVQLRRKLRNSSARAVLPKQLSKLNSSNSTALMIAKHLQRLARKTSRRFWSELARDKLAASDGPLDFDPDHFELACGIGSEGKQKKRKQKIDPEQVIDLVKGSLNQLIDAQLLLRNKLAGPEQLNSGGGGGSGGGGNGSPAIINKIRSAEYEQLLRNNFNLLKIWQNLEETKEGLVCFVCEPIKANLADLFWFNRRRLDWPQATTFDSSNINSNTSNGGGSAAGSCPLLSSPLVCLESSQVKRGLLQILEALNFLHTICRLIHRNLNPNNILICHGDNWKLSGLELAVRFESTLISESASMMAHEFNQATRFPAGAQSGPLNYHLAGGVSGAGGISTGSAPLRRQHTLHQTKCQAFERRSHCGLLQPELDYLAPEILRQAKCSHKSDLFSFGLILGQTYDLCRHKSQISCRSRVENYEIELKKLDERRKWKLARAVPLEMGPVLVEMLDCEPNLRPSAGYALQTLKRPLELCNTNEDSLRHLKSSLDYLENRFNAQTVTGPAATQTAIIRGGPQEPAAMAAVASSGGRRASTSAGYFRRVTSAAANQAPKRRQTRMLQLLNYFVRALDATTLALDQSPGQQQQQRDSGRRHSFGSLRLQSEQTLEILRQVLKSCSGGPAGGELALQATEPLVGRRSDLAELPADSRSLLLLVALHRRLLDQVGRLRQELPPICRLIAPSSSSSSQPLDRTLTSSSHRALADLEERLSLTISQQSIGRLVERLSDPLLKLEEFLLVFELVNDLVGFVGQKWRQNFCLRGKQLLNELTPVTGCPSLSSSEEETEEEETWAQSGYCQDELDIAEANQQLGQGPSFGGSTLALTAMQANVATSGAASPVKRLSQQSYQQQKQQQERSLSRQQLYNLPTSINVTAPSPMGSTRDVSRSQAGNSPDQLFSTIGMVPTSRSGSPLKRHSHQDVLAGDQLVNKTSQISLNDPSPSSSRRSIAGSLIEQQPIQKQQFQQKTRPSRHCDSSDNLLLMNAKTRQQPAQDQDPNQAPQDDESRSRLIDELLKTINDDSFNEFIDFNNKLTAVNANSGGGSASGSQPDQMNSGQLVDLVNANRPKSAQGGDGSTNSQTRATARPPRTLNLSPTNSSSSAATANKSSVSGPQQLARASGQPAPSNQQQSSSTFDNVIRRMSTNFVQNFNKMSAGTLGSAAGGGGLSANEGVGQPPQATGDLATSLRREKSSNATYSNCLYVDNQIPARRHSDNTINVPRIQVALSSPSSSGSRTNLNQRASVSASKLATKWKLTAKTNQREASDKLSPNLSGALGYIRRHSSGNTQGQGGGGQSSSSSVHDQNQSNGLGAQLFGASPFKTRSNSNLGIDFLMSNRSMKRRCSAASMLGHQTQRKAEDLIDAGMKSVQNMFN